MRWFSAPIGAVLMLSLLACGGGSRHPAGQSTATETASPCPRVTTALPDWPRGIPADIPRPPGMHIVKTGTASQHAVTVFIDTALSLRESQLLLVREVPKAGYVLGRGDTEEDEADISFRKIASGHAISAAIKVTAVAACRTTWYVVVARPR